MRWEADESNIYLMHYGIKGQKHGQRRFQNEDGTLTPEGMERYGRKKDRSAKDEGVFRGLAKSSWYGRKTAADYVERKSASKAKDLTRQAKLDRDSAKRLLESDPNRARKLLNAAERKEKMSEKFSERHEAQKAANLNRKAYENHSSTAKLVTQDMFFGKHGAQNYRAARARGAGRVRSFFESTAGIGLLGTGLAALGNKKAYGKHIVLGDNDRNDYKAVAMDHDDE